MILVNGAGQIGMLIRVDGIRTPDAPATVTIKGGSRFIFANDREQEITTTYTVLGDAEADEHGNAFLAIDPSLTVARADNEALLFTRD